MSTVLACLCAAVLTLLFWISVLALYCRIENWRLQRWVDRRND